MLASSSKDPHYALGQVVAECEVAGMKNCPSKSKFGAETLSLVEKFGFSGSSQGKTKPLQCYKSVMVKKELSRKAKFLIYQSIYVHTLTYGH